MHAMQMTNLTRNAIVKFGNVKRTERTWKYYHYRIFSASDFHASPGVWRSLQQLVDLLFRVAHTFFVNLNVHLWNGTIVTLRCVGDRNSKNRFHKRGQLLSSKRDVRWSTLQAFSGSSVLFLMCVDKCSLWPSPIDIPRERVEIMVFRGIATCATDETAAPKHHNRCLGIASKNYCKTCFSVSKPLL